MFNVYASYGQLTKGIMIQDGDTIEVKVKMPIGLDEKINYNKLQRKLKCYDDKGEKNIVKAKQVDEVVLYYGDTIRMLRHKDPIQVPCEMCVPKYVLLKLIVDGELKLFQYFNTSGSVSGIPHEEIYYYYQKRDEELFTSTSYLHTKKEMTEYFSDCESLVQKIENKEFKTSEQLVKFYNTNCMK